MNKILVRLDNHYEWFLDSTGKPFLKRDQIYEPFKHTATSGIVLALPDKLAYPLCEMTEIELQVGDRVIFDYLAIDRDKDGKDVHSSKFGDDYFFKYSDMYVRIRDEVITPINGWVILKGEYEEYKTNLIIPDHIKKKQSKMFCTIEYQGAPIKKYFDKPYCDWPVEKDEFHIGQKVIIPTWCALPLQKEEHAIINNGKLLYRTRRCFMWDYATIESEIREYRRLHPAEENPNINEAKENIRAVQEFDKNLRESAKYDPMKHILPIIHRQTTKHKYKENTHYISK